MIESSNIAPILSGKLIIPDNPIRDITPEPGQADFSDLLAKGIESVQKLSEQKDQLSIDLALGKPVELHQVMLAATKAQIAMELLLEIRNKLIEAYQEISRMPV